MISSATSGRYSCLQPGNITGKETRKNYGQDLERFAPNQEISSAFGRTNISERNREAPPAHFSERETNADGADDR